MSKALKEVVKEIQYKTDLTLDQIAEKVDLSPAYFRNEVSKGISESITKKLLTKFKEEIEQNDSRPVKFTGDLSVIVGQLHERMLRAEAHLEVYESAIAGLQSNGKDFPKQVGDLREQVRSAVNRRLDELKKK